MGSKNGAKNGAKIAQGGVTKGRKPGGGAYLYRREGIFYYRYAFPKNSVWSSHTRELRVSLKTSYVGSAQRLASQLYAITMDFLEKFEMSSDDDTWDGQEARLDRLRSQLRQLVDELLDEPGKQPISVPDARKKLNGYLKRILDDDAASPMPLPISTIIHPDKSAEQVSIGSMFDDYAKEIVQKINSFDDFDDWYYQSVMEMISEGIFRGEEISKKNSVQLSKLFLKTLAIYNQVKAARVRGDYSFEQPFIWQKKK